MYFLDVKNLVIGGDTRSVTINRVVGNRLDLPDSPRLDYNVHARSSTLFVLVKPPKLHGNVTMTNVVAHGDIVISNVGAPAETLAAFSVPDDVVVKFE